MRNMAEIVTVKDVFPMLGKDRICAVTFNEVGYEVIVPKVSAIPGNKMIFIQEGSVLPVKEQWEFLRKRCFSEKLNGFLIKPMIMGKKEDGSSVKSWGLAVSPSDIEEDVSKYKSGDDVTKILGIWKYEPEENEKPLDKKVPEIIKWCFKHKLTRFIGKLYLDFTKEKDFDFPTDIISKSDETTIQNLPGLLEKHRHDYVYVTAKMEGQSVTTAFEYKNGKVRKFYVCSRNRAYKKRKNNDFWNAAKRYGIEEKLRKYLN